MAVERAEAMLSRNANKWDDEEMNFQKIMRNNDERYRLLELALIAKLRTTCSERGRLDKFFDETLVLGVRDSTSSREVYEDGPRGVSDSS